MKTLYELDNKEIKEVLTKGLDLDEFHHYIEKAEIFVKDDVVTRMLITVLNKKLFSS